MSGIDVTAPPTPSHSSVAYQLASPTSTTALTSHADQYAAAKIDKATAAAASTGPVYPPLTWDPRSWVRFLIFYIRDRDYNLWVFTFAFVLLFFAYPIQGVQTIRYPKTGSSTLLILYGFYGITSLFAAPVIDIVGPEWCMPMGALTYGLWIASFFSGSDGLVLAGAAAFGWGAGLMWPAAGNILATISTPHNRGSNNGIFQMGFHLGVFSGGLTLAGVINAYSSYNTQYAVFLGLCGASLIMFIVHIFTFRARYRVKKPVAAASSASVANAANTFRVVHDDGTVEFRTQLDSNTVRNADVVVADLALNGGRGGEKVAWTWRKLGERMWQSIQFLWHPIFGPCVCVVASIGGVNQGWLNASFSILANKAGAEWVGYVYAIGESFSIVSAILFGWYYDRLRKNYNGPAYRYVMYYGFFAVYAMCAMAMGTAYLFNRELGDGPGQLHIGYYRAALIVTLFFYSTSWLALEISIYTYLTTFMVYNADIGFSTKVFCEAMGYMISYGLSEVLGPRDMVIVLFVAHLPAAVTYLIWFKAPDTPAPVLLNPAATAAAAGGATDAQLEKVVVGEVDREGVRHTSSTYDLNKGVAQEEEQKEQPKEEEA